MLLMIAAVICTASHATDINYSDNKDIEITSDTPTIKQIIAKRYAMEYHVYTQHHGVYSAEYHASSELTLADYRITSFNELGDIISDKEYDANGLEISSYTYNTQGLVFEETVLVYIQDEYYPTTYHHVYDDKGNKTATYVKTSDGRLYEDSIYIYDTEGNLTDSFTHSNDGEYMYHTKHGALGQPIVTISYWGNDWEYWNKNNGGIESIRFYNNNTMGVIPDVMDLEWHEKDDDGYSILRFNGGTKPEITTSVSIEYDNYGNVVKKTTKDNNTGKIIEVIKYEIQYVQ